jgi:hypothetical protein
VVAQASVGGAAGDVAAAAAELRRVPTHWLHTHATTKQAAAAEGGEEAREVAAVVVGGVDVVDEGATEQQGRLRLHRCRLGSAPPPTQRPSISCSSKKHSDDLSTFPYHCGAVRMCACHGLEQEGVTAIPQPPSAVAAFYTPSRLGLAHHRLERQVCDPSLGPGTGLAQRSRSQGLPACEEASATSAPLQHRRRAGARSSHAYTHL